MSTENKADKNHILYGVIVILLVVIALLWGYVLGSSKNPSSSNGNISTPTNNNGEDITVTIIDDKRCSACQTEEIVSQLKLVPFLMNSEFIEKDFTDDDIETFLKENSITALPAIIFNTNNLSDGGSMSSYLIPLKSGDYSLQIGSTFDPFQERSDKGFLLVDSEVVNGIKTGGYVKWNPNAKILWVEYSDLECPFCARLHNASTINDVFEKYGENIQMIFQHYPLDFHPNAFPGAELLECAGSQNGAEIFYSLIEKSFKEENSSQSFLLENAENLWVNRQSLEECIDNKTFSEKIENQLQTGQEVFGVTGTPWNVLINIETNEYEVISWAYPTESFMEVIDKLVQ